MSKQRECIHCRQLKPLSEFFKNKKMTLGVESKCKNCAKLYQRKQRKKKWEQAFYYAGGQCEHCGISNEDRPEIYDFHHKNPEEKEYQLADLLMCKWERVKKEIDKCILLCSNCHKTEHKRLRDEINI